MTKHKPKQRDWHDLTTLIVGVVVLGIYSMQWRAAAKQNELTAGNFKSSQRAWVGVDGHKSAIVVEPGNHPIRYHFNFHNFGSSPAKNVRWNVEHQVWLGTPTQKLFDDVGEHFEKLSTEGATTSTLFNSDSANNNDQVAKSLSRDEYYEVMAGKIAVIMGGKVEYDDIFNDHHVYTFCYIYNYNSGPESNQDGNLGVCPTKTLPGE